jgi:hypothetical protein
LTGLLNDEAEGEGGRWLKKIVRQTADYLDSVQSWPGRGWAGWEDLAHRLRLDQLGPRERKVARQLLSQDPLGLRNRVVERLAEPEVLGLYRRAMQDSSNGGAEQVVLTRGLRNRPREGSDDVERALSITIELIDAYELVSGLLETIFRGLLWGLTRHHGQAPRSTVVAEPVLRRAFGKAQAGLEKAAMQFRRTLQAFEADAIASLRRSVDIDRMHRLLDNAVTASLDVEQCVSTVMERHRNVQKEKGKGVWIDEDRMWTLMPGFGDVHEEPPLFDSYLHSFRIPNAYSMLADLGVVRAEADVYGEDDN